MMIQAEQGADLAASTAISNGESVDEQLLLNKLAQVSKIRSLIDDKRAIEKGGASWCVIVGGVFGWTAFIAINATLPDNEPAKWAALGIGLLSAVGSHFGLRRFSSRASAVDDLLAQYVPIEADALKDLQHRLLNESGDPEEIVLEWCQQERDAISPILSLIQNRTKGKRDLPQFLSRSFEAAAGGSGAKQD